MSELDIPDLSPQRWQAEHNARVAKLARKHREKPDGPGSVIWRDVQQAVSELRRGGMDEDEAWIRAVGLIETGTRLPPAPHEYERELVKAAMKFKSDNPSAEWLVRELAKVVQGRVGGAA